MISNISLITLIFYVKPCSVFQPFCFGGISFVDFYGVTGIVWGLSDEKQIGARLEKEIEMYCSNKALERLKDIVARDSHRNHNGAKQILNSEFKFIFYEHPVILRDMFKLSIARYRTVSKVSLINCHGILNSGDIFFKF